MKQTYCIPVLLLLALILVFPAYSAGFVSGFPREQDYYSADGRFVFAVTPKSEISEKCNGELLTIKDGRLKQVWRHSLENRIAPAVVMLANDGTVVTLDNWDSVGTGDDVLVIYAPDGKIRFSFSLEQILTEQELRDTVPETASSRWWRSIEPKQLIDETRRRIILTTTAGFKAIPLDTGNVKTVDSDSESSKFFLTASVSRGDTFDSTQRYEITGRLDCLANCNNRYNWFIYLRPGARYPQRLRLKLKDVSAAKMIIGKNVKAVVRVEEDGNISNVRAYIESLIPYRKATMKELYESPVIRLGKDLTR